MTERILQKTTRLLPWWVLLFFVVRLQEINAAGFPVLPEFQIYHTVGNRGSSYSTGALGLALHLYDEPGGPGRYLHLLALQIPKETIGWKSRVAKLHLEQDGVGFELAVHDQWSNPAGKGATLSLRQIQWAEVKEGDISLGEASSDTLHMGWSWVSGTPIITVWLLGLDFSTLHLPNERPMEAQLALGLRTYF